MAAVFGRAIPARNPSEGGKMNHRRNAHGCLALLLVWAAVAGAADRDFEYEPVYAQPYRLAIKAGSPDLLGLELEALVPGARGWLGAWVSGTYLPIGYDAQETNGVETEKDKGGLDHIGIGANLYFTGTGQGFLASVGYDRVSEYTTILKTQTGKESWSNPIHLLSLGLAYKYVGNIFAYSLFGGYGFNFAYRKPAAAPSKDILFHGGNWILAGMSLGVAIPMRFE
jgi:hypothetical protein